MPRFDGAILSREWKEAPLPATTDLGGRSGFEAPDRRVTSGLSLRREPQTSGAFECGKA